MTQTTLLVRGIEMTLSCSLKNFQNYYQRLSDLEMGVVGSDLFCPGGRSPLVRNNMTTEYGTT